MSVFDIKLFSRYLVYPTSLLLFLLSCFIGNSAGLIAKDATWHDPNSTFKVWVLSDIQPKEDKHREAFQEAILDINKNVPGIQMAIVGGDIANRTTSETYDWYLSRRALSYIKDWNEIAGNHDLKTDLGELYREKIKENFDYSIARGNILFIFMSDEVRGKPTGISNETFNWWKELVINNQDKIILVMTHAPLEGSGIPFSYLEDRQVTNSKRFTDVLKEYQVDIWFSGHLHLPHFLTNNIVQQEDYNGTIFINVSSIRPEMYDLKKSESRIITFVCDSDQVLIQARNHNEKKFNENLSTVYGLSKKFKCE